MFMHGVMKVIMVSADATLYIIKQLPKTFISLYYLVHYLAKVIY